jgi:hypothetical protein
MKITRSLSDSRTHSNLSDSTTKHAESSLPRTEREFGTDLEMHMCTDIRVPKIFFGSRTHKQLVQIIKELKTTTYRPNMTVLGSRDLYCIHKNVSKSNNKIEEW